MPYFENQNAKLYYEEHGQGEPLIFLHGASWDMREWDRQVEHFAPRYHVITLDARGHGRSTLPPGAVDPDIFWRDVVALMDHLGISAATLCGLSMGGHVALQVAIHAGARVKRLILMGAICTNAFNLYERLVLPVNRFSTRLMPMSWLAWCEAAAMGRFCPAAKPYIREVVGNINHDVFNRVWCAITKMESRAGLPRITCPTLILYGDHDTMTRRQQEYMHGQIRGSRLVVIKNASHGANMDNPAQVEAEMERFLQESPR